MNIKKIIGICKRSKRFFLYESSNKQQWISDGAGYYPLLGLPWFNEELLCQTYDITESQRVKFHFKHESSLPTELCFDDTTEREYICEEMPVSLISAGRCITPYITSEGAAFIDTAYLAPVVGKDDSMLGIYERYTPNGLKYFAVKSGLMLLALVFPYNCINEPFAKDIENLNNQCKAALMNKLGDAGIEDEQMAIG